MVLKQLSTSEFKLSSKLKLLLENLKPILEDSKDKVIIFSHFIGFLDIIHLTLRQKGIDVLEFKGTMNNKKRAEIIEEFNKPDGPRILAISIKAGGVGLNLTVANWVFLMEPWWNPAFEQQALDRVYRIGQKKPVTILKFICSETIEERIKNIQLGKDILAQNTLQLTAGGQGGPGDPRKPTEGVKQNMENLKKLFV